MTYTPIDPVAFDLGVVQIHWYGLMWLCAFVSAYLLARVRADASWQPKIIEDLIFYGAIGAVLGGRIGYMLFYNFSEFLANPLSLVLIHQGGMSFHGGVLGVLCAIILFNKRYHKTFFQTLDFAAPLIPLGLGFGRIGNFINSELWGKETASSYGVTIITETGELLTRYPSQLYQAFLEGVVLFTVLWLYSRASRPLGSVAALFAILYGVFRVIVEFVRMPDAHIGYLAFGWLTMGQLLSVPLIIIGIIVFFRAHTK